MFTPQQDLILYSDLSQDALMVGQRVCDGLEKGLQDHVAAALLVGGQLEIRIRLKRDQAPIVRTFLIGSGGELCLNTADPRELTVGGSKQGGRGQTT